MGWDGCGSEQCGFGWRDELVGVEGGGAWRFGDDWGGEYLNLGGIGD